MKTYYLKGLFHELDWAFTVQKNCRERYDTTLFIQGGSDISGTLSKLHSPLKIIFFSNYFAQNQLSSF
jgi:hypothetical protein